MYKKLQGLFFYHSFVGTFDMLKTELQGAKINEAACDAPFDVEQFGSADGSVTLALRKGKLICVYDVSFDVTLRLENGDAPKAHFTDVLSDCTSAADVDMRITPHGALTAAQKTALANAVLRAFDRVKERAFVEHGDGVRDQRTSASSAPECLSMFDAQQPAAAAAASKTSVGSQPPKTTATTAVSMNVEIDAPIDEVWGCLFDEARVRRWSRAPAKVAFQEGGTFSMLDSAISGTFERIDVAAHTVVQKWRQSAWPVAHFSTVTLTLKGVEGGDAPRTRISLQQCNVPRDAADGMCANWESHVWRPIRAVFGCGAFSASNFC